MNAVTMNKTGYKTFTESGRGMSLMERFQNYVAENSAVIVSGLMSLNGNGNAYAVYRMLKK